MRFSKQRRHILESQLPQLIEEQRLQQAKVAEILDVSEDWVQRACKRLKLATQRTGPRAGEGHPNWQGGTFLRKGYRYCWTTDGYKPEHRLVMAMMLGRGLESHEVVHHKDGNPLNNAPSNLELFQTNAEHLRHELTGRIPQWTEDGKRRISEGALKSIANRQHKSDGDPQPQ